MKIAYLIVVHRNPQLLKRAIRVLSTEDCGFYIHLDRKTSFADFSQISGENVFFSRERIPVYWGEFSQVAATMLLIKEALAGHPKYDRFLLLQGSDYPLRSGRYIRDFFEENKDSEFISLLRMPAPGYPLSKINAFRCPSTEPFRRFAARALGKIGLAQRDYRKYLGELEAYSGIACWALSRRACEYVVEFSSRNPQIERYFRNTFTSDEMFFHTILGNSPFRSRTRRNLVFLDWIPGSDHPLVLGNEHLKFFESNQAVLVNDEWGSGEILFARKLSDDVLDVVDRIDEMIRLKDAPAEGA